MFMLIRVVAKGVAKGTVINRTIGWSGHQSESRIGTNRYTWLKFLALTFYKGNEL